MLQNWHLRARSHSCAQTGHPFTEGDSMITAIYFDPETGGYLRRDVSLDAWDAEVAERTPYSHWRTHYQATVVEEKPEITSKEGALHLLQRLVEDDDPATENARYILAVMLERKKQLVETDVKESEHGKMRFYENRKGGDIFIIRDPELRLDEIEQVQDEVAMLLGFGGPAAAAAKSVGMKFNEDGKLESANLDSKTLDVPIPEAESDVTASPEAPSESNPAS